MREVKLNSKIFAMASPLCIVLSQTLIKHSFLLNFVLIRVIVRSRTCMFTNACMQRVFAAEFPVTVNLTHSLIIWGMVDRTCLELFVLSDDITDARSIS